jgi:hypothetical protein
MRTVGWVVGAGQAGGAAVTNESLFASFSSEKEDSYVPA